MQSEHPIDVAILGGGLAGSLLARQLRMQTPGASVALFEKTDEPRWKVGESTVEIASNYLVRRQGLSSYLFDQHLPKMGLRFFFDTPEKDAELTQMSEIGTDRSPPFPSFQLDRARLERDLRAMAAREGVEVGVGWTVQRVELGKAGAPHRVHVRSEGEERTYRARWVIDATGRASTIARMEDLRVDEPIHHLAAVWGRYRGVQDIDTIRDDAWRRRARYVSRGLSTNHFCYPGYWIWFIPLGRGVTSVGVVGHKDVFRRGMRTQEGFRAFLDEHRAAGELMKGTEALDLEGYTQLAYGVKRFFSSDRWALIGDASAFADPFYSPGSDFISMECDYASDLIGRDLAGDAELAERVQTYDDFMQFRWEATMRVYRNLYSTFGSYELLKVKFNFDFGCYLNLWFDPFAQDKHLDLRFLQSELRRKDDTLAALHNFACLFGRVEQSLRNRGAYHRGNLGNYNVGVDTVRHVMDELTTPRKKSLVQRRLEEVFNYGRDESLLLLGEKPSGEPLRLHQFGDPL
ncbi:MAG: NAD(P)/FAD-dependent oxidoreductase [Sandaracinaceae bacterium]|nr:NAD(P)/FAD-dependent oxidoreductase [Sandaracinaceae bacterium]